MMMKSLLVLNMDMPSCKGAPESSNTSKRSGMSVMVRARRNGTRNGSGPEHAVIADFYTQNADE